MIVNAEMRLVQADRAKNACKNAHNDAAKDGSDNFGKRADQGSFPFP
jgi:hypothetical protein